MKKNCYTCKYEKDLVEVEGKYECPNAIEDGLPIIFYRKNYDCDYWVSKEDETETPSYYNRGKIEVIDFIDDQALNFNLGNVVKYVCRAGFKDDRISDLQKAKYYIEREIDKWFQE